MTFTSFLSTLCLCWSRLRTELLLRGLVLDLDLYDLSSLTWTISITSADRGAPTFGHKLHSDWISEKHRESVGTLVLWRPSLKSTIRSGMATSVLFLKGEEAALPPLHQARGFPGPWDHGSVWEVMEGLEGLVGRETSDDSQFNKSKGDIRS